ncbi:MAG: nucleoside triphosphate pyrophosphohydrolase [bacterium]
MGKELKYDKLVRDNIPQIIEDAGKEYAIHTADDQEYLSKLYAKVLEELQEFKENPSAEEMADIFEVLDGLISFYDIDNLDIKSIKKEKREKRGGFKDRIILETVKE